eukprot:365943-Chlamydomonas_euryale.AAC.1
MLHQNRPTVFVPSAHLPLISGPPARQHRCALSLALGHAWPPFTPCSALAGYAPTRAVCNPSTTTTTTTATTTPTTTPTTPATATTATPAQTRRASPHPKHPQHWHTCSLLNMAELQQPPLRAWSAAAAAAAGSSALLTPAAPPRFLSSAPSNGVDVGRSQFTPGTTCMHEPAPLPGCFRTSSTSVVTVQTRGAGCSQTSA